MIKNNNDTKSKTRVKVKTPEAQVVFLTLALPETHQILIEPIPILLNALVRAS